jgi:hypothetical protein
MTERPNPARDLEGTLPPAAEACDRSEGLAEQRVCCGGLEYKKATVALWVCACGRSWLDVGADIPGGGAA